MGLSNKREFEFELLNFECQLSQFTLRNRIWNFAVSLNGYFVFGSGDLECRVSVTGGKRAVSTPSFYVLLQQLQFRLSPAGSQSCVLKLTGRNGVFSEEIFVKLQLLIGLLDVELRVGDISMKLQYAIKQCLRTHRAFGRDFH